MRNHILHLCSDAIDSRVLLLVHALVTAHLQSLRQPFHIHPVGHCERLMQESCVLDLWLNADIPDSARTAYKAGYVSGSRVASRVEVMRWELLFYCKEFCRSEGARKFASHIKDAKLGFIDGFAAAQNRKALTAHVLLRGTSTLSRRDDRHHT